MKTKPKRTLAEVSAILKKNAARKAVLERAFAGVNVKDLASRLETSSGTVYNIKYGRRQVSAIRAIQIEKITAEMGHIITRNILRPDVFGN